MAKKKIEKDITPEVKETLKKGREEMTLADYEAKVTAANEMAKAKAAAHVAKITERLNAAVEAGDKDKEAHYTRLLTLHSDNKTKLENEKPKLKAKTVFDKLQSRISEVKGRLN
jgi:hypothetical protein